MDRIVMEGPTLTAARTVKQRKGRYRPSLGEEKKSHNLNIPMTWEMAAWLKHLPLEPNKAEWIRVTLSRGVGRELRALEQAGEDIEWPTKKRIRGACVPQKEAQISIQITRTLALYLENLPLKPSKHEWIRLEIAKGIQAEKRKIKRAIGKIHVELIEAAGTQARP